MIRAAAVALLCACTVGGAAAQAVAPKIPADAGRGKVDAVSASLIRIDGKDYRLAPGARFVTVRNLTVTPNRVAPGTAVRYALDGRGQVRAVWLLDDAERATTGPVQRTPAAR